MLKVIYSIEGNIGSGKSTLLSLLQPRINNLFIVKQPVDIWQNIGKHNLLDCYYKDPTRWAYTFQTYAILSRMSQLRSILDSPNSQYSTFFSQRSVMADKHVFAKLLFQSGNMTELEHELYLKIFDSLNELFRTPRLHRFIYLRTSPERCLERMKKRGRFEEKGISLDYLKKIHDLHEKWLKNENAIVIDGEEQFQTNQQLSEKIVGQIVHATKQNNL